MDSLYTPYRPRASEKPTLASGFEAMPPEGTSDARGAVDHALVANGMEWRDLIQARYPAAVLPRSAHGWQGGGADAPTILPAPSPILDMFVCGLGMMGFMLGLWGLAIILSGEPM